MLAFALTWDRVFNETGFLSSVTDSAGGTWSVNSPAPLMGDISDAIPGGSGQISLETFASCRTSGPTLSVGDTVFVHMSPTFGDPADYSVGIVYGIVRVLPIAVTQGGFYVYNNGDAPNQVGGNPTAPNWTIDYGGLSTAPDTEAAYIASASSFGGNNWRPVTGTRVAQVTFNSVYLAINFKALASAFTDVEPGGTFSGGTMSVVNYQYIEIDPSILAIGVFRHRHKAAPDG